MRLIPSFLPYLRQCHYRRLQCRLPGRFESASSAFNTRSNSYCSSGAERKWQKPTGFDTGIKTYNSLTKRKESLILAKEGTATWYSCGPTVYDHAHLGHACSYVRFDILQRILSRVFGIYVIHVMVITDIDDKIIKRASEENMSPTILARLYEEEFKNDMEALKVLPPTVYMRVTENIPQIIAFIEGIIKNQHAYCTSKGNVYFDIQSIGDRYGKLMVIGDTGGEPGDTDKRDARDFALWKKAKIQEPSWDSPWGKGRPGWHIECSTIASSVFGSQLDVHSGGIDLAFPHHENEIAQCEAYHRCAQWGNYFLHSGHLHLKGSAEKMSKSLKNYITIKDFLQSFTANEFRMFCLLTKYRSAIDYSTASMNEAKSVLFSISTFISYADAYIKGYLLSQAVDEGLLWERLATTKVNVQTALSDDFDTPRAVDAIMSLIHHGNRQLQAVTEGSGSSRSPAVFGAIQSYIRGFLDVVGVDIADTKDQRKQAYFEHISILENWCRQSSSLEINVTEIKELLFNDRTNSGQSFQTVVLNGQSAEDAESFNYLGTHIDQRLSYTENIDYIFKKANRIPRGPSSVALHNVVDELVKFRSHVRRYALATDELPPVLENSPPSEEEKAKIKQRRRKLLEERQPLLRACDDLRDDLAPLGILIKDRGNNSTWEMTDKREELNKDETAQ